MEGKWAISQDEEHYQGDFFTKDQAVAEAEALWPGEDYFVAQCADVDIQVSGEGVIDQARADACDEAGEHAESWLDSVTPQQVDELTSTLTDAFERWEGRHGFKRNFYTVKAETVESRLAPDAPPPVVQ
jgi:hypothetical protein